MHPITFVLLLMLVIAVVELALIVSVIQMERSARLVARQQELARRLPLLEAESRVEVLPPQWERQ